MKQLSLTLDDTTFLSAEARARQAGKSLPGLVLDFLARFAAAKDDDFERLEKEEFALRERLKARGAAFSAENRLSRDELHDRHALR